MFLLTLLLYAQRADGQTRIMPLGDSITGSPGCWRALLWNRLQNGGFTNIDFVGTMPKPSQECGLTYDGDHEGHGGITTASRVANEGFLPGWLVTAHPNIVIMHFGTNDVWLARTPAQILADFSTLVDQMRTRNPNMAIFVAQIIPMAPIGCPECPKRVIAFNAAIPGWATAKSTPASPLIVVDQYTGFNATTDTSDGVHPNDSGLVKIADNWYLALSRFLNTNDGGEGNGIVPNGSYRITPRHSLDKALDVTAHGTADHTPLLHWSYTGMNNQRWTLTHLGKNVYQIIGVHSGKALEATAGDAGVYINVYTGAPSQRWKITATDGGFYRITPISNADSALTVAGNSSANGASVQQQAWHGEANQQWALNAP